MVKSLLQLLSRPSGLKRCLLTGKRHIRIEVGNCVAEFEHGFSSGAESGGLLEQVDALLGAGETLKDGDTCYVSRITWNERDVVVKRYNHKGFIHSLRHTIKKSRARKAWLYAHYLAALGIATPKPLAYIEHRKGLLVWQSYLLTEYVEGRKLWSFLRDDGLDEQQRRDGMRQVVEMLDRLWRHHITHGDLKHTNILITENGPVLTDLDGMIFHRWGPLFRNRQAKDVQRFLRKTDVSPELHNYCEQLISSRTASCKINAEVFDKVRLDKWTVSIRKNFPESEIENLLSVNDLSVECRDQFTKVASSDYARVFRGSVSFDGASRMVYLKQYLCRSKLDFVKHFFRASRAKRAFNASLMLRQNGFDTPAVVGLFERRIGPFCTDNFLLTEEVGNAGSMVEVLTDLCADSDADTLVRKRDLIRAFAETLGRMHAEGIFHGDLRLGNVLVAREEQKWRFFFIDNERTRKFYNLPSTLRLKNLVQVNMFIHGISNTDRLRFFRAYLSKSPSIRMRYGRWAQKIIARTNKRLSRKDWLDN
ncbi:MAG: lipopolysaccharide kinase InaA family protein [Planctomycetota bacterium]|nr:lipopolysaccharide kinase InaA family protein [Planctomycetota bacterium]